MFYNSRKAKKVEIGGSKFTIKPPDCRQQIEFFGEFEKGVVDATEYILCNFVEDIENLKDENGSLVDFKEIDKKELTLGLSISSLRDIVDAVVKAVTLPEEVKKKSRSQAESGSD